MNNSLALAARKQIGEHAPDKFYAVVDRISANVIEFLPQTITAFPNRLDEYAHAKRLANNNGLSVLHLGKLRNGEVEVIAGEELSSNLNPKLISGGVIVELEHEGKRVLQLTQRDNQGGADDNELTTVAGRYEGHEGNIDHETESLREWLEEGLYLGEVNGEIHIILPQEGKSLDEMSARIKRFIGHDNPNGVIGYLGEKYFSEGHENYEVARNTFEENFQSLCYSDLKNILTTAYQRGKILFYQTEVLQDTDKNKLLLDEKEVHGFKWFDKQNNTWEVRLRRKINLDKITDLDGNPIDNIKLIGNGHAQSLYLESFLQGSVLMPVKQEGLIINRRGLITQALDINGKVRNIVPTVGEIIRRENEQR